MSEANRVYCFDPDCFFFKSRVAPILRVFILYHQLRSNHFADDDPKDFPIKLSKSVLIASQSMWHHSHRHFLNGIDEIIFGQRVRFQFKTHKLHSHALHLQHSRLYQQHIVEYSEFSRCFFSRVCKCISLVQSSINLTISSIPTHMHCRKNDDIQHHRTSSTTNA